MSEPIFKSMKVRCSLEHAFKTFTQGIDLWWPHGHRAFADGSVHLEAREGGRFYERSASGELRVRGQVVSVRAPERLVYTWLPGSVRGPTRVCVCFEREGEHTLVKVEHAEGDSALGAVWPQRAQGFAKAWADVLPAFVQGAERSGADPLC